MLIFGTKDKFMFFYAKCTQFVSITSVNYKIWTSIKQRVLKTIQCSTPYDFTNYHYSVSYHDGRQNHTYESILNIILLTNSAAILITSSPRSYSGSVLATGPKVRGFTPGRGRRIFKGDKNP
jgi:hypothetical protein